MFEYTVSAQASLCELLMHILRLAKSRSTLVAHNDFGGFRPGFILPLDIGRYFKPKIPHDEVLKGTLKTPTMCSFCLQRELQRRRLYGDYINNAVDRVEDAKVAEHDCGELADFSGVGDIYRNTHASLQEFSKPTIDEETDVGFIFGE